MPEGRLCLARALINIDFWCIVVHIGGMRTKPSPPLPFSKDRSADERIRLTIPVTAEVHAAFKRLAAAGSMSTGRAMADWLADTIEAVEFMASTMERARAAPKQVIQEMHAYALGLTDETGALMKQLREKGAADRAGASAAAHEGLSGPIPPSCNTGGKVPQKGAKRNKDLK